MDVKNNSFEDFVTFKSNDSVGNYSYPGTDWKFRNPFQIPFARVLFITCYALVFATCIVGEYCLVYVNLSK